MNFVLALILTAATCIKSNVFVIPPSLPSGCTYRDGIKRETFFYEVLCPGAKSTGYLENNDLWLSKLDVRSKDIRGKDLVKFHDELALINGIPNSLIVDTSSISSVRSTVLFTLLSEEKPKKVISYYSRLGYDCGGDGSLYDEYAQKCWELDISDLIEASHDADRKFLQDISEQHKECKTVSCLFRSIPQKSNLFYTVTLAGPTANERIKACQMLNTYLRCKKQIIES
jgi:hypothetical protein